MTWLTTLSLLLFLAASFLLSLRRYVWDAFLMFFLSGAGLLLSFGRRAFPSISLRARLGALFPRTISGWARAGALLVALLVAFAARGRDQNSDFTPLFLWWLFAVAGFVVTLVQPLIRSGWWRRLFVARETYYVLALLVAACLVRVVGLGRIPANLGGDEGSQLMDGLRLIERPLGNPFATGWYSVPTMSFLAYGAGMRLFGATVAGGRALSAMLGTLTVFTTFLLARSLGGRRVGWIAAFVIAFSSYHIHFSRLASNQIADPLIGTLALWLLWCALSPNRLSDRELAALWGGCGVVAGVGWYAYFGARWISPLIGLILLWRTLSESRFFIRHWRGFLMLALGWIIVVLPLLAWYTRHPSPLTERFNAVGVFASGWMEREVAATGKSVFRLMLEQFWKSATAFNLTPDPTFWYYPQMPLVDFVTGAFLWVGMLAALLRLRWPSRGLVLIWFWSTLTMAWVLTENPPSSQRGLLLMPAVALFVAWGGEMVWEALSRHLRYAYGVGLTLLGLMVMLNLGFYFGVYTPQRTYGNPSAEVATTFAQFVRQHPHPACEVAPCQPSIYFHGPPYIYWGLGSLSFLLRDQLGVDVQPEAIPEQVDSPARFVFVVERLAELERVKATYPGGLIREVTAMDGRILAVVYDW